jgi:hypothetical protein
LVTCPKTYQSIVCMLCPTRSPPQIFKSSVSNCNFFAAGKAIPQYDT